MTIRSSSPYRILAIALLAGRTRGAVIRLIVTIFHRFFWPQFHSRYLGRTRPVVTLDHPLDKGIPFQIHHLPLYVSFFHLWIRSMSYMHRLLGRAFLGELELYLKDLNRLYLLSYDIHSRIQSTTDRPTYPRQLLPRLVAMADPHLHCFPSLHVIVVLYNHHKMQTFVRKFAQQHPQLSNEANYAYEQALKITESVLLVKQHSLYCISASLFLLSHAVPEFGRKQARIILGDLFGHLMVDLPQRTELQREVCGQFESFCLEVDAGIDAASVLLNFLEKLQTQGSRSEANPLPRAA